VEKRNHLHCFTKSGFCMYKGLEEGLKHQQKGGGVLRREKPPKWAQEKYKTSICKLGVGNNLSVVYLGLQKKG